MAADAGQLVADPFSVEGLKDDVLDPVQTVELRQRLTQRVTTREVIRAVGRKDHQPCGPKGSSKKRQQIASGAVGPVKVFDNEQNLGVLGLFLEDLSHCFMQPRRTTGTL